MRKGTHHHIRKWVHSTSGAPLQNLMFSKAVDLSSVRRIGDRREIVSCVFEDDVVWSIPRIAGMVPSNLRIETRLVFRACTFKKPLNWARCLFIRPVVFFSCRFEGCVDFTLSRFRGASFEDCTFQEKVFFEYAAFLPERDEDPGNCPNSCPVSIAAVRQGAQSDSSNVLNRRTEQTHCANFRAAVFRDGAEFDWVRFDVPACFYKAEFHGATTFLQSGFGFPAASERHSESTLISLNCSHAEVFGTIEFHRGLKWIGRRVLRSKVGRHARLHKKPPTSDGPEITPHRRSPSIWDKAIRADMRYIHIRTKQGLRFHSENLSECLVLGTNLGACHFTNVRWPMVDSYFPLQFKTSLHIWGLLPRPGIEGTWLRDFICIFIIFPFHLVQSFIATAMRVIFRWMVRHDTSGNRSSSSQARPSVSSAGVLRSSWRRLVAWLKTRLAALSEYLVSCTSHEQHGIFDHKEQIRKQEDLFRNTNLRGSEPQPLYQIIKAWRDQWAQLSRAYRDLKSAYEDNKDYIYASDFHFAEKELRRINHEVPRHTRFQLQLYWLVSGYGERVLRPIWWFLAIWLLGALPYYLWGTPSQNEKVSISVQTTAKAPCEAKLRSCNHAALTEGSEGALSPPKPSVESSP